jgi:hypothetical protein
MMGTENFEFPSNLALSADNTRLFVADQRAVTVLAVEELTRICVLALSQPACLTSARPAAVCPFALCTFAQQPKRGAPLSVFFASYDEHVVREATLCKNDLRSDGVQAEGATGATSVPIRPLGHVYAR